MEQEKLYVIEEKTYESHIDEEVHLYGLLHQLAFLAGKVKDRRDMENLIDTARPVSYTHLPLLSGLLSTT